MQLVRDWTDVSVRRRSYVTVGVFDGVHRGHQHLIGTMVDAAHAVDCLAAAYTFHPHPNTVLGDAPLPLLTTVEERAVLMAELGVDMLVAPEFTLETVRTRAVDFVNVLLRHLGMVELWVGPDFALGYRREGTPELLAEIGAERGFVVRVIQPLMCDGGRVSSTRVRAALRSGDIARASECLGRYYRLTGSADRQVACPALPGARCVGLHVPFERLVPANGAYACQAHTVSATYPALVYTSMPVQVGDRPREVKVYLLGGAGERLVGQRLALDFVAFLQEERALNAKPRAQIRADAERARWELARHLRPELLWQPLDLEGVT
jgi:riboflavin kinase/FMN adenylyltransferase